MVLHFLPQIATPRTTSTNSFTMMCISPHDCGHCSSNHSPDEMNALQLYDLEASDVIVADHLACTAPDIRLTPFHVDKNHVHHWRSEFKPLLSLIWWCNSLVIIKSVIILLRSVLLGLTTQLACLQLADDGEKVVHECLFPPLSDDPL